MIDVKIRGEFLQVDMAFINPRHVISVEMEKWSDTKGEDRFIVKLYCTNRNSWTVNCTYRNSWTVKHETELDCRATFNRIGDALELMGGQADEPKWQPGNETPLVERTEEGRELDRQVAEAEERLALAAEGAYKRLGGE